MSLTTATALTNRSIANYKIVELIGTGGMANIYKAIQLSLDRPVALKTMHPHLIANEGFVARFEKEAKQAAMLQHENIVSIIDYGCDDGEYFIAMEYVDGKNLKDVLEKQKRLPLEICLLICHQVAEGLKYAHSHNLVHRDIKPANIILSTDGRVMITDFGIAKANNDLSITTTGQTVGSPAYMSPEQAAGKLIDHRSDLFSLGIILYEIIAGEKPFKGDTYQGMVASIMSAQPKSLRELRVDVTPEIETLVEKILVKVPDSRFQTAEELSEAVYAQLTTFKIPSYRKLVSSYLQSPIRVTEKLRADKIANHMESALYSLTLGEGKLAEAKREFEDVLRYDKNNKAAKRFLSKLESHSTLHKSPGRFGFLRSRIFRKYAAAAAVAFLFLVSIILIVTSQVNRGAFSGGRTRVAGSNQPADAIPKPIVNLIPRNADLSGDDMASAHGSAGKKEVAQAKSGAYNYPRQDLARFGWLKIATNVPADLIIDRVPYGRTNGPPIKVSPGRHYVEASAQRYQKVSKRIFTEKDKTLTLDIELLPKR